jgi:hypothetical protein
MNTVTKIALIAGLTTASLGTSYAMDSDDHEASAVVSAKIDMSQAIASAESAAGNELNQSLVAWSVGCNYRLVLDFLLQSN